MRIWSIHLKYLDGKGLGAQWRETLLAQKVLLGKTVGWKKHPQLTRFKEHSQPIKAVGYFLREVYIEAKKRGYNYDYSKIIKPVESVKLIEITLGQLQYEYMILMDRLNKRNPKKYDENLKLVVNRPEPHPIFQVMEGPPALWEKAYWRNKPK
jgi:hypothetical protein